MADWPARGREQLDLLGTEPVKFSRVYVQQAHDLLLIDHGDGKQGHEPFFAGQPGILELRVVAHVLHGQRGFLPDHPAEEAVGHLEVRLPDIAFTRPVHGLDGQFEPRFVEQHQRAELERHEFNGLAGDPLEDLVQIQRRDDILAHRKQGRQFQGLPFDLGVELGVVNDPGGLMGQRLEQFQVRFAEGVLARGVHVEHADHLLFDDQRHGELRQHVLADGKIAFLTGDVRRQKGLAVKGDPAGDAFAEG